MGVDDIGLWFAMDNKMLKKNEGKAIVLNRMYVGDYLSTNLGHEVINMFQADNGGHYLYLNASGNFGKEHSGKIGYMLLVKYHSEGVIEVIGKAEGLTEVPGSNTTIGKNDKRQEILQVQSKYIEQENISYGQAPLLKIFNNAEQQNIFITYKAESLYKPCKRIFIGYANNLSVWVNGEEIEVDVVLNGYNQAKTTLKTYAYPEGTFASDSKKENVEEKKNDYAKLLELIDQKTLWVEQKQRIGENVLNVTNRDVSIFDICQIQNDENRFSFALQYFMEKYPKLWKMFFAMYGVDLDYNFTVAREESVKIEDAEWKTDEKQSGRIDLLIRDNKNIVVIENKIKSDINSISGDDDAGQLKRYYNYINWTTKEGKPDEGRKPHFFILAPHYNLPKETMDGIYKVITYRELFNFLEITEAVKSDCNFKAFYEAMHRHTHDNVNDYLYYEMLEKFVRRINEINQKK